MRPPLIHVEPQNSPPDVLHMKKAIITKMLNQVVDWVILQGKEEELLKQMRQNKIPFRFISYGTHINACHYLNIHPGKDFFYKNYLPDSTAKMLPLRAEILFHGAVPTFMTWFPSWKEFI